MANLQKLIEEAKLIEKLERRGMDGISSKVAKEVLVLFEDRDLYAFTGEKKTQHDAGGSAADDATGCGVEDPSALRHAATVAGVIARVNAKAPRLQAGKRTQIWPRAIQRQKQ
jgi:hypothetical protein